MITSLVGSLSLLLPLLSFACHLRTLHGLLEMRRCFVFSVLTDELFLMNVLSSNVIVASTVVTLIVVLSLFLLDDIKIFVFSGRHQV